MNRLYFKNYYKKRLNEYINMLGGKCKVCNSIENLEFDHINSKTKLFSITKFMSYSKDEILKELSKCQLLCKKCHRQKTIKNKETGGGLNKGKLSHGSNLYNKGCRCNICLEYNKKRNERRRKKK